MQQQSSPHPVTPWRRQPPPQGRLCRAARRTPHRQRRPTPTALPPDGNGSEARGSTDALTTWAADARRWWGGLTPQQRVATGVLGAVGVAVVPRVLVVLGVALERLLIAVLVVTEEALLQVVVKGAALAAALGVLLLVGYLGVSSLAPRDR